MSCPTDSGADVTRSVHTDLEPSAVGGQCIHDAFEMRQDVRCYFMVERVEVDCEKDPRARLETVVEGSVGNGLAAARPAA